MCHLAKAVLICTCDIRQTSRSPKRNSGGRSFTVLSPRPTFSHSLLHFYITTCFITCQIVREQQSPLLPAHHHHHHHPPPPRLWIRLPPRPPFLLSVTSHCSLIILLLQQNLWAGFSHLDSLVPSSLPSDSSLSCCTVSQPQLAPHCDCWQFAPAGAVLPSRGSGGVLALHDDCSSFWSCYIKIVALIMDEMAVCYGNGLLLVSSALQKPRGVVVFVLPHLPAEQSPDLTLLSVMTFRRVFG